MTAVATGFPAPAPTGPVSSATRARRTRAAAPGFLRERGMGASILVAALSSAFGVVLIAATVYIGALLQADPYIGGSGTLALVVGMLSVLLTGVAVYVAAIVTANTFATIVAGRTRRIALMRLIGASARSQRTEIAGQGFVVGLIGAVLGLVAGIALALGGVAVAEMAGLPAVDAVIVQPVVLAPALVVVLTTWVAAWAGSRRVLAVTPLEALGGSVERSVHGVSRPARNVWAIVLFALGAGLLALGILVGLITPLGIMISFVGGLLSFTGLALGSVMLMPPVLRMVGRWFGKSATARLAAENALRHPERSSRMAIGVVMGVTLVTMFAVAMESAVAVLAASAGGELPAEMATVLDSFTSVMMALVGVSAVIAAVGLVNLLTIGVVQRRRELGLLRALGFANRQVRRMVLLEAAHVTIAALVTGLVLGIVYGWAGAQSLLGSVVIVDDVARTGPAFVWPALPLWSILIVVVATAVLTLIAAATPTRLATRVAPVAALAGD